MTLALTASPAVSAMGLRFRREIYDNDRTGTGKIQRLFAVFEVRRDIVPGLFPCPVRRGRIWDSINEKRGK